MVGEWGNRKQRAIRVKSGVLNRVNDYKHLGSWLLNSNSNFEIRKQLTLKAIIRLYLIWKNDNITREVKVDLFRATIAMTNTLERLLDDAYTKLLTYALNVKWLMLI